MAVVIKVGETEAVSVDIGEKVYIQGDPGFSPTIEVTDITGGHRLTITDITGDKTVDVMNGAKGDKGATGDTGATGNGIEYITLNADYTLTVHYTNGTEWTSASIRGEKGDKGDTGATGPTGQPGQTGATPDISIGTVTTGAAGSQAEATMTGTPERPVLNLTIPRGDPGEVTQAEFDDLSDEVTQQKSAIEQAPTEETGQELLSEEELNTLYTEYFLKTLDRIFSELPQDESLSGIVDALIEENSWLDQLYREVAAAKT